MSTLSARLKRLEKRFPSRRYDPDAYVTPFRPDAETLRGAFKGAIVAGLMPMISDAEISELVKDKMKGETDERTTTR